MTTQSLPSLAGRALPVLITRPEPQAGRFARELAETFGPAVRPVVAPLMEVQFDDPPLPAGPFAGLVFTSETGVEAARRLIAHGATLPQPVFCVGPRTAAVARAAGFVPQLVAPDAATLVPALRAAPDPGRLLWLRGRDRAADLPHLLPDRRIDEAIAYTQRPVPLTPGALALLSAEGPVVVPLFSPRSTLLFLAAAPARPAATLLAVAISEAAAEPLPPGLSARVEIAERPDGAAMLAAIGRVIASVSS